ncbi:hypothetical protein [Streptomyces afghaniensis]|nr:hypothetical protein [Streptomyces afghaniensis]MDQ1020109.1 hypothetical protein [Streptomyces afghaniensis]
MALPNPIRPPPDPPGRAEPEGSAAHLPGTVATPGRSGPHGGAMATGPHG